jgi:hypothetical protein
VYFVQKILGVWMLYRDDKKVVIVL